MGTDMTYYNRMKNTFTPKEVSWLKRIKNGNYSNDLNNSRLDPIKGEN